MCLCSKVRFRWSLLDAQKCVMQFLCLRHEHGFRLCFRFCLRPESTRWIVFMVSRVHEARAVAWHFGHVLSFLVPLCPLIPPTGLKFRSHRLRCAPPSATACLVRCTLTLCLERDASSKEPTLPTASYHLVCKCRAPQGARSLL